MSIPHFLRIARLIAGNKLVDLATGNPTTSFQRSYNDMISNIESAVNSLKSQADDIAASLMQAGIALTTAEAVQAQAQALAKEANLINSYVDPKGVLTAEIDPADSTKAKITIANHNRVYGDTTTVAVTGGSISGLNLATDYFITYMDAARAGGAVTYSATSDFLLAGQQNDQHLVGDVTTPGSGAPPTTGGVTRPPGAWCVTVDSMILMANATLDGPGHEARAGALKIGDHVWTQHEDSMEWGAFPVVAIELAERDVLTASGFPDATAEHPFWIDGAWVLMDDIGTANGRAMIAHMMIGDAHTFVARHPDAELGILSHNKTVGGPDE